MKEKFTGFHILERPSHLIVTTPQTFASGDPAHFFVSKKQGQYFFDDCGTTHNALELSLPTMSGADGIIMRTLQRLDSPIGFEDYALHAYTDEQGIDMMIGEFVNVFAYLTTYRPKTINEQAIDDILNRIEQYLLARFGNAEKNIHYKGLSGIEHRFKFQSANHIFEFAEPKSTATGVLLRKIHDVKGVYDELDFSIFLNDSDKRQFDQEARILDSVANIKPLSLLAA